MTNIRRFWAGILMVAFLTSAAGTLFAGSGGPPIRLRVHLQTQQGTTGAIEVELVNPPEKIYVERNATIFEKDISWVHIYQGPDGPGAKIQFGMHGRLALETMTNAHKGRFYVVFVNGRPVVAEVIEHVITDGVLNVEGLTFAEAEILKEKYPRKEKKD